jgi:hypothetical protein
MAAALTCYKKLAKLATGDNLLRGRDHSPQSSSVSCLVAREGRMWLQSSLSIAAWLEWPSGPPGHPGR